MLVRNKVYFVMNRSTEIVDAACKIEFFFKILTLYYAGLCFI